MTQSISPKPRNPRKPRPINKMGATSRAPRGPRRPLSQAMGPKIRWEGLAPLLDERGREIKRFYRLDTLVNAVEFVLRHPDRDTFLTPSIQGVMGNAPVSHVLFELFLETRAKLVFRMKATNTDRRQASFAVVVAKNHEVYSAGISAECLNLQQFAEKDVEHISAPLGSGHFYLPEQVKRPGKGREIAAYVTLWPQGFHELGVGKNLCFYVGGEPVQPLTPVQTEMLKAEMTCILAHAYDSKRRVALELPDFTEHDFFCTRPQQGKLRLKLMACRGVVRHVRPAGMIHRLVGAVCRWRGNPIRLAPDNPGQLLDALERAVGAETARQWLNEYREAIASGRLKAQPVLSFDALDALGITGKPGTSGSRR